MPGDEAWLIGHIPDILAVPAEDIFPFVPVRQLMVRPVAVGQQLKFAAVRVRVTD